MGGGDGGGARSRVSDKHLLTHAHITCVMSDTLHTLYLLIRKTTQAEEVREQRDKTKGCKLER